MSKHDRRGKLHLTDEEVDMVLHDLIAKLRDEAAIRKQTDSETYSIISPQAVRDVADCELALRRVVSGDNIVIHSKSVERAGDYGCIRVLGSHIRVGDPQVFLNVLRKADVFELLPKTDGNVEISMSFFHITQEVQQ